MKLKYKNKIKLNWCYSKRSMNSQSYHNNVINLIVIGSVETLNSITSISIITHVNEI